MTSFLPDIPLNFTSHLHKKEAIAGETVTLITDMSKPGMEVNQDCTYKLIIPDVAIDDTGEYTVEVGELQSTAQLTVFG